jgi:hypothetical protein
LGGPVHPASERLVEVSTPWEPLPSISIASRPVHGPARLPCLPCCPDLPPSTLNAIPPANVVPKPSTSPPPPNNNHTSLFTVYFLHDFRPSNVVDNHFLKQIDLPSSLIFFSNTCAPLSPTRYVFTGLPRLACRRPSPPSVVIAAIVRIPEPQPSDIPSKSRESPVMDGLSYDLISAFCLASTSPELALTDATTYGLVTRGTPPEAGTT